MTWRSAVADIADRLLASASATPGGLRWAGPEVEGDADGWQVVTRPVGAGLYAGRAGITLFLAAASRAGLAPAGAAAETTRTAWSVLDAGRAGLAAVDGRTGMAEGAAAVAWATAWAGSLLDDRELVHAARGLAADAAGALPGGGPVDLLGGGAGAVLCALATAGDRDDVREACLGEGRRVAAAARPEPLGCSWPQAPGGALLGLAHGSSGIALALAEVAAATGEASLRSAVDGGLDHERCWYDEGIVGWPDLRNATRPDGEVGYPALWCHGAVGIGLARFRLHELDPSDVLVAEAGAAVHAARRYVAHATGALREGVPTDCTLCHGLAGAGELFLQGAAHDATGAHLAAARSTGDLMLRMREAVGEWPCGVRDAGESPGLFLGVAGVGLTLLRMADPASAPGAALPVSVPRAATALR